MFKAFKSNTDETNQTVVPRIENLMAEKVVTLRDSDGGFTKYPIFGRIKYRPEDGLLIKFNEDISSIVIKSEYPNI